MREIHVESEQTEQSNTLTAVHAKVTMLGHQLVLCADASVGRNYGNMNISNTVQGHPTQSEVF